MVSEINVCTREPRRWCNLGTWVEEWRVVFGINTRMVSIRDSSAEWIIIDHSFPIPERIEDAYNASPEIAGAEIGPHICTRMKVYFVAVVLIDADAT